MFFFKQKTAYEMRISDWSSDVCSSDLFGLARRNELVDHHLSAVDEIAELGFPNGQRVRLGRSIAVFKGQHGLFGQYRVDDRERRLVLRDVLQGNIGDRKSVV